MPPTSLVHRVQAARSGTSRHPALVLLHGRGADENDLFPLADELDPRLYVITVRAPFAFGYGGYVWYDLDQGRVGHPVMRTLSVSLEQLARFLGEIVKSYPIDPHRIYVGGFSNGAATSGVMALTRPDLVAGAIMLSGYFPVGDDLGYRPKDAEGHPIFAAHGTLDPVIPVLWARLGKEALEKMPVALTYREYPIGHEISGPELQELSAWLTAVLDAPISPASQSR